MDQSIRLLSGKSRVRFPHGPLCLRGTSACPLVCRLAAMEFSDIAILAAAVAAIATITYIVLGVFAVRYLRRIADKR